MEKFENGYEAYDNMEQKHNSKTIEEKLQIIEKLINNLNTKLKNNVAVEDDDAYEKLMNYYQLRIFNLKRSKDEFYLIPEEDIKYYEWLENLYLINEEDEYTELYEDERAIDLFDSYYPTVNEFLGEYDELSEELFSDSHASKEEIFHHSDPTKEELFYSSSPKNKNNLYKIF